MRNNDKCGVCYLERSNSTDTSNEEARMRQADAKHQPTSKQIIRQIYAGIFLFFNRYSVQYFQKKSVPTLSTETP